MLHKANFFDLHPILDPNAPSPVTRRVPGFTEPITFPSAAAAYHAFKDPTHASAFVNLTDPKAIYELGHSVQLPKSWTETRRSVTMRAMLQEKFTNNPGAFWELLETKDDPIDADSGSQQYSDGKAFDSFWGIGSNEGGNGKNTLGILLMSLRSSYFNSLPKLDYVSACRFCGTTDISGIRKLSEPDIRYVSDFSKAEIDKMNIIRIIVDDNGKRVFEVI